MRQIFKIERKPFQDEYGFALLPVMQIETNGVRGNCTFCNGGCRPDKHHAYWPKPTTSDEKLETRIAIIRRRFTRFSDRSIQTTKIRRVFYIQAGMQKVA